METTSGLICGSARSMDKVRDASVDLIVTFAALPNGRHVDDVFISQDDRIGERLAPRRGPGCFRPHASLLDTAWEECSRVLKPGGLACINIGDATRTLDGDFQLYSNHSEYLVVSLDIDLQRYPTYSGASKQTLPTSSWGPDVARRGVRDLRTRIYSHSAQGQAQKGSITQPRRPGAGKRVLLGRA